MSSAHGLFGSFSKYLEIFEIFKIDLKKKKTLILLWLENIFCKISVFHKFFFGGTTV
jgi:hypothetical protein